MDYNPQDTNFVEVPFDEIVKRLTLLFHIRFNYFFWVMDVLCHDEKYEGSLYKYIADKHGIKQGTVASALGQIPDRARRFAPDIFTDITGSDSPVLPLPFLHLCANWIKTNTNNTLILRRPRATFFR